MANISFDHQNTVEVPTLILQNRNFDTIGVIPNAYGLSYREHFNSANELSFTIYKELNGQENPLWDAVTDFKILYVPNFQEHFEISVSMSAEAAACKSVTALSLCEAELGQTMLRNIEINTENDILNPAYDENFPTIFYRDPDDLEAFDWSNSKYKDKYSGWNAEQKKKTLRNASLLHRIFNEVPHYSFDTIDIDDSLKHMQREFSISETDIYSELTGEIAEEFNCLFLFDSMNRKISVRDLYNTCNKCNYRGDFSDKCPECGSTEFSGQYGKDTAIFITNENLATQINLETDSNSLKNCFYVEGGDDRINVAIRSCNPNGRQYLYYFSEDTKKDMPALLKEKIESYDLLYSDYNTKRAFSLSNQLMVDQYNSVVTYVTDRFPNKTDDTKPLYTKLQNPLVGYPATTAALYEATDLYLFLKSGMMPAIDIDGMSLDASLNNIVNGFKDGFDVRDDKGSITKPFQNEIAIQNHTTAIQSTVEHAILNTAKLFYNTACYDLKLKTQSYIQAAERANGTWQGAFILTSLTDSSKTVTTGNTIRLTITGNVELFIQQSIYYAVTDRKEFKDKQISSLQLGEKKFIERIEYYSLDELSYLLDSFTACVNIIISADINDETLKNKYTAFYNPRIRLIENALSTRNQQLEFIKKIYYYDPSMPEPLGILYHLRKQINNDLDLKKWMGENLWKLFFAYRREDKYSNSNYISEGLTNAQIITHTNKLLDAARKELFKAGNLQYSITTTMNNLMAIKEFQPLVHSFAVGNWLRIGIEDKVYTLRLLSYQINFDEMQTIDVEFSTVEKIQDGSSDISSIINSASSMASSYQGLIQQVDKTNTASSYVNKWLEKGFTATQTKFANADNQNLVIDSNGLLARAYDSNRDKYSDCQLKIVNNGLYTTNDGWETINTGIGRISYVDPESDREEPKIVDTYGIIAQSVVGKLFLGEKLGIYSMGTDDSGKSFAALKFNSNGLEIKNGKNTVRINPNDDEKLFWIYTQISPGKTEDVLFTDNNGNLHVKGIITATSGTFSGTINASGGTFTDTITCKGTISGGTIKGATITGGTITGTTFKSTGVYGELGISDGGINILNKTAGTTSGISITNETYHTNTNIYDSGMWIGNLNSANTEGMAGFMIDAQNKRISMHYPIFTDVSILNGCSLYVKAHVAVGGYDNGFYALSTANFICNSWVRTVGSTGWYNETYGGGWYMTDSTYVRIYNNKALFLSGGLYINEGKCRSNSHLRFANNKGVYGTNTSGTDISLIKIIESNNVHVGTDGYNTILHGTGPALSLMSDRFRPETDDGLYCGDTTHRWKRFYAVNGTISTSDRNYKKNIRDIPDIFEQLFLKLQPKLFQFLNGDRDHIGAISQEVEDTMKELGIKDTEFAGFCRDIKTKDIKDAVTGDIIGKEPLLDEAGNPQYIYSLCYQEFIFLLVSVVQKLYGRVENLENQIH